jgi:ubiquinone/menaquinone biosynthesis C-methylase UbiE
MGRPKDLAFDLVIDKYRPRQILDYGCGPGWYTQRLALHFIDAEVVGIDLSDVAVEQAARRMKKLGICNASFQAMDAEHLTFEDESFDLVTGLGILHHLELKQALNEIERVLTPGGAAVFVEPLAHNPGLRLFRRLTPLMRTEDEHPLTMRDLKVVASCFSEVQNHFVNLTTLIAVPVPRWLGRTLFISALGACDQVLFEMLPLSRRFAWSVVIVAHKAALTS